MYNTYDYENSQAFPAFKHSAVNMYGGTEMMKHTLKHGIRWEWVHHLHCPAVLPQEEVNV
jgi:hypothetical protein